MAKAARKRKKDKEDDELAAQVAEIASVTKYMERVTDEEIQKKGDLYLRQGAMIAGMEKISSPVAPHLSDSKAEVEKEVEETKLGTAHELISEAKADKKEAHQKIDTSVIPILEIETSEGEAALQKIDIPGEPNTEGQSRESNETGASHTLITTEENEKISAYGENIKIGPSLGPNPLFDFLGIFPPGELNQKILGSWGGLIGKSIGAYDVPFLSSVKVVFEQEPLVRFINGTTNILFTPDIDNRTKTFLIAVLYDAAFGDKKTVKIKSNDILKALGIHKKNQKKIPEEAEKAGLATFCIRRKGGTEVTFNEEIFKPNHANCSKGSVIDRLIDIYNLSINLEKNNEEKTEEKKNIPLQEIGRYISILSLHLAGFPLKSITSSLVEAIRGKAPELVTAFWIYARNNASKIKTPSAYLIKVINNNDTSNLSGEIMESAKACVRAAQVIVRENYDEPELSFLRSLAQRLSIPGRWDREDRKSLTARLQMAGRELVKECEKALGSLSKKGE